MNELAIESFIDFCDDMQIAQEGSIGDNLKRIKDWLIDKFQKLIQWITDKIRKAVETRTEKRTQRKLQKLLKMSRDGLKAAKALSEEGAADELVQLFDEITNGVNNLDSENRS